MLLAAVVNVEALHDGQLPVATGRLVHGLWFHHWRACAEEVANALHDTEGPQPFTLSPVMGLTLPHHGKVTVRAGERAWFRLTTLTPSLSEQLATLWLPRLPETLKLGRIRWRVLHATADPESHPWAGALDPHALAQRCLLDNTAPDSWSFTFETPTTFHGEHGHLPFPLPYPLLGSWLRRWEAFGPVPLPEEVGEAAREGLGVSSYRLKTVPVRERRRLVIGCVGDLQLRALVLQPLERAAVDLLARYAFWAGSGHHTTQGFGMTRLQDF